MKLQSVTTTLFALLAFPLAATAQETGAQESSATGSAQEDLPDGRSLIQHYVELTGTAKVLSETTSARTKGTLEVVGMGISGPMEVLAHKSNKMVVQIEMGAMGSVRQGFDGETAWMVHPMMGATIQEGAERMQTVLQANYTNALKSPEFYERVKTLAKTDFEGASCWKVEIVAKAPAGVDPQKTRTTRTSFDYYDVETGLLAGTEAIAASPMGEVRVVTIPSDYKKFGARLVPGTVVQKMGGQEIKMTTESIVYDDVDLAAFALPKEIQVQRDAQQKSAE